MKNPVANKAIKFPETYNAAKVATFCSLKPPINVKVPMNDNKYPQPAQIANPIMRWVYVKLGQHIAHAGSSGNTAAAIGFC